MTSRIENTLKEYRQRKEKESKNSSSESTVWERIFSTNIFRSFKFQTTNHQQAENHNPEPNFSPHEDDLLNKNVSSQEVKYRSSKRNQLSSNNIPIKATKRKLEPSKAKEEDVDDVEVQEISNSGNFQWLLLCLKLTLWIVLYLLALEFELGALFVVITLFYLILTNFRQGSRKPWEPSAYSVFNPGCEPIEGTIKPEQFEREIRYGF